LSIFAGALDRLHLRWDDQSMAMDGCGRGAAGSSGRGATAALLLLASSAACGGASAGAARDAPLERSPQFVEVEPSQSKPAASAPLSAERVTQASRLWLTDRGTCALASNRDIYCWGARGRIYHHTGPFLELVESAALSEQGQLTLPSTPLGERSHEAHEPQLPALKHLVRSPSGSSGCGLKAQDSTLSCFGIEKYPPGEFVEIVAGAAPSEFFCGLRRQGQSECWPGRAQDDAPSAPPQPAGRFRQISSYCGLREDGTLSCWSGYLQEHPEQLPKLERLYYSTSRKACGLDTEGQAGCWGAGAAKPLVRVAYDYAYFGDLHACGVRGERVECWGYRGRGASMIPGEVGSFIPNRLYKLGATSLPLDVALEPLPKVDPQEAGCRKRLVSQTRGKVQVLAQGLMRLVPTEAGDDGALLNLSVSNSAEPVWISCPSGNYFRWSYADKNRENVRHDLLVTRPGKAAIAELGTHAGGSVRSLRDGNATLSFAVAGFLITETTNEPGARPAFFSETGQLDRQALAVLGAQLESAPD
jgi:hypothetical protein